MGVGGWTAASDETTSCATALCRSPQRSPPAASPGAVWGWQRVDLSLPEHSSWLQCLGCSASPWRAHPSGMCWCFAAGSLGSKWFFAGQVGGCGPQSKVMEWGPSS